MNNQCIIKYSISLLFVFATFAFYGCSEEERITYYDPDAPAPIAINPNSVIVKNLPGKVIVRYERPTDENLLYVKAIYESAPGVIREAKASLYVDTLVLEGFGATGSYPAKLYCVGKNKKESTSIEITVSPQTPPIVEAFPTVHLGAVFGGIRGEYKNEHKTELKAVLLADTIGNGIYTQLRSYVSNNPNAKFSYIGLEAKQMNFAIYLQDRYGNRTDTMKFDALTPLYEESISNSTWEYYQELPSDYPYWSEMGASVNYAPWRMWDNDLAAGWGGTYHVNRSSESLPFTLTIRLGATVILSRIVIHHWRLNDSAFGAGAPKIFEVWGSNLNRPGDNLFGGDWTMLGNFESEIPSGNAQPTQADKNFAIFDGEPFFFEATEEIPNPFVPTKFIRFRFLGNWRGYGVGDPANITISELKVFGQMYNP